MLNWYINYHVGTSTKVNENTKYKVPKIAFYAILENKISSIKSESKLSAISLSMWTSKLFSRNSFFILLRSLVLIIFIAENAHSVIAVDTGRVKTRWIDLSIR